VEARNRPLGSVAGRWRHGLRTLATMLHQRLPRRAFMVALVLAVVGLAALAGRASAAPRSSVPLLGPGECDGCNDDAQRDEPSETGVPDLEVMPRVITAAGGVPIAVPIAVRELARAAVRAAGLAEDRVPGWRYRARLAGLVPIVSSRYGRNSSWKEVNDPTLANTNMFDVRATWQLERLMFDPNELRIDAIDVSRRREKRRVEQLAIHSYYAWLGARELASRSSAWQMRADELAADLDAITGGWFAQALAQVKR
jgi:hypothetical protein